MRSGTPQLFSGEERRDRRHRVRPNVCRCHSRCTVPRAGRHRSYAAAGDARSGDRGHLRGTPTRRRRGTRSPRWLRFGSCPTDFQGRRFYPRQRADQREAVRRRSERDRRNSALRASEDGSLPTLRVQATGLNSVRPDQYVGLVPHLSRTSQATGVLLPTISPLGSGEIG
jgi:hypothetical protein